MGYSPGIRFETSLVNMYKAKGLTKRNQSVRLNQRQKIRCQYGSINHLRITTRDLPVGISYQKAKKMALGMGISQSKKKKVAEY